MTEALLTASDRNDIIKNLMSRVYSTLNPAEKLALDIHNTNLALKKALDTRGVDGESIKPSVNLFRADPWENRSTGMRCSTCMWAVIQTETKKGRCRRHAPTMSGYPVIFGNDWCGDHKLA